MTKIYNNMTERPECGNKNCNNGGLILAAGTFLCGKCYNKLVEKQNNAMMGWIEE